MSKKAFNLQQFAAHADTVNCLKIGPKSCQVLVTGGEDKLVNMWAIGKPNKILSLSGHSSAVDSVTFSPNEDFVVAGSAGGSVKMWDIDSEKCTASMSGHRSNVICLDHHPHGDYFASGSVDTNLKIWDIRKKTCIQTYKGHSGPINVVRFSPDGRWVVSGGEDGTIKVWDLGQGKLIKDFREHDAAVSALDFHPQEFLMCSGSQDRTVRFWDLEIMESIACTDPEATKIVGTRFSPDGKVLLSGSQEGLRVWNWEPCRSFDYIDVGWVNLKDMDVSLSFSQLVGCAVSSSFVSVWVVKLDRLAPYSDAAKRKSGSGSRDIPVEIVSRQSPAAGGRRSGGVADIAQRDPTKDAIHRLREESQGGASGSGVSSAAVASSAVGRQSPSNEDPVVVFKSSSSRGRDASGAGSSEATAPNPSESSATEESSEAFRRTFIRPPSDAPLGLDIEKFAGMAGQRRNSMSDQEIMDELLREHHTMCGILAMRLTNIKVVRSLWMNGDTKGAVDQLVKLSDPASQVDILAQLFSDESRLNYFNLSHCVTLLPVVRNLLQSEFSEYVLAALKTAHMLFRAFGEVIKSTLLSRDAPGVDLSREERIEKCSTCLNSFLTLRRQLEPLEDRKDEIGMLARALLHSLAELSSEVAL